MTRETSLSIKCSLELKNFTTSDQTFIQPLATSILGRVAVIRRKPEPTGDVAKMERYISAVGPFH